ncbi:hypothetical protein HAT86_04490 [Roseovarius gahaiensis]|uniref:Cellulose biosynthesis protein BcsS n=1 Tax=Roseovarius gahaiensis TaxID=2716691 RepID=A0A967B9C0_9RHOB|nr:hypothetical protein [Roseovarius gahaiensis]NHQ73725.1 hypothetical protein [Roseovarius gahaiensis]
MILLCLCSVVASFAARTANAGLWPREAGKTFLSLSWERDLMRDIGYATVYAEYGLSDRLTLGLDIGADPDGLSKAIAFARFPFGQSPGGMRLALEMGTGVTDKRPVMRPAMSFGRGIDMVGRSGWLTLDIRATVFQDTFDAAWESDLTLGLNATARGKAIMQLQTGQPVTGDAYVKLGSSWVMQGPPGRHIEFGVVTGLKNSDALAAKIALWHAF